MIEQIIQSCHELHMTQSELAKKVGTQKSNISRLAVITIPVWTCLLNPHARTLGTTINETVQAVGY